MHVGGCAGRGSVTCVFGSVAMQMFATLQAILPHITHADILCQYPPAPWHAIFCPASTTHTLTHLVTHEPLEEDLASVLVRHAPALKHLTVSALSLQADMSGEVWSVTELVVTEPCGDDDREHQLDYLPQSMGGVLNLRMKELCLREGNQQVSIHAHTHTHTHPASRFTAMFLY